MAPDAKVAACVGGGIAALSVAASVASTAVTATVVGAAAVGGAAVAKSAGYNKEVDSAVGAMK